MDTADLSERLAQLLKEATATTREIAIRTFVQELMVALAREDYRLDDLARALAEYARGRSDWVAVVHHLEAAATEVARAKTNLKNQSRE